MTPDMKPLIGARNVQVCEANGFECRSGSQSKQTIQENIGQAAAGSAPFVSIGDLVLVLVSAASCAMAVSDD